MTDQNPPVVKDSLSENTIGAIAYITIFPAIALLLIEPYRRNSFVRFHAWQSILLNIVAIIISLVMGIIAAVTLFLAPVLFVAVNRIIWLCWVLIWIFCAINAVNGKRVKLPIIGALAEKQAGS